MNIQKIPLRERLQGLSDHIPGHEEYIPALLRNFAQLPITVYLADFPEDVQRLADLVQYPAQYLEELTYSDIAERVRQMHLHHADAEALEILAKPFITLYQRHLERSKSHE